MCAYTSLERTELERYLSHTDSDQNSAVE